VTITFGTTGFFVFVFLHQLEPGTEGLEESVVFEFGADFIQYEVGDIRLGEIFGEVIDYLSFWKLLYIDALTRGNSLPKFEKMIEREVIRDDDRVNMGVPVPGASGNFQNESSAENTVLPGSTLPETPETSNDILKHLGKVILVPNGESEMFDTGSAWDS